ncbi:MAG: hypothetical protein OXD43_11890, partial [Bacteroidetes bacterium]|nr:hypothetical protein [Bacteroidota bacterium]
MRPIRFTTNMLTEVLQRRAIATLPELAAELGHCSSSTVYRKLKQLDYLTSYSHGGKYYALRTCADFDAHGLWFCKDIRFSNHGTLRSTAKRLVEISPLGYRSVELDEILKVRTIDTLASLVRENQLARIRFERQSVYCAVDPARQQHQIATRRIHRMGEPLPGSLQADPSTSAAVALFFSLLDEKQQRLFAGLTSLLWGYGGDKRVANLLGLNRKTVRRGRRELHAGEVDPNRVRKPGGGRPSLQKNPWMIERLLRLVQPETAGDPMGGLLRTRRSLSKLSVALKEHGIKVCPTTVGKWLRSCDYSPRVNWKCLSRTAPPERDEQF